MQAAFAISGSLRQGVTSLLLSLFICLSMIPAGFMPVFSGAGATMTLCSGFEQKDITLDDHGQPVRKTADKPCVFSLNASTPVVILPSAFSIPDFEIALLDHAPQSTLNDQAAVYAHAARAPPVTL